MASREIATADNYGAFNYISFLPAADVVDAELLDTEALLCLVETPQPMTPHRPSLAFRAPAATVTPQEELSLRKEEHEIVWDLPYDSH